MYIYASLLAFLGSASALLQYEKLSTPDFLCVRVTVTSYHTGNQDEIRSRSFCYPDYLSSPRDNNVYAYSAHAKAVPIRWANFYASIS